MILTIYGIFNHKFATNKNAGLAAIEVIVEFSLVAIYLMFLN